MFPITRVSGQSGLRRLLRRHDQFRCRSSRLWTLPRKLSNFNYSKPPNELKLTPASLATVQKIVTEILPPGSGLAFGKDARDLLIECCVEFITLISSEANEISEKESKKTIACEHITKALEQLGFGEYVSDIMEVASEHKEQLKVCFIS